jgi:hypothetical protein
MRPRTKHINTKYHHFKVKFQIFFTCCCGAHDYEDSTHTVQHYPLVDSALL